MEIDDRRRDDVDVVASRDEPADELTCRDDRAAERARGRPGGRSEEDAEPGIIHRY
jgi:hypothetical protein